MRSKIVIIIIIAVAILTGCSSTKKAIKAPLKDQGADFLVQKLNEKEVAFSSMQARFNMDLESERLTVSLRGQIRMEYDSIIWMSISKAGLEIYRVLLTPDSLFLMDRFAKIYMEEPNDVLYAFLNNALDYDMVQAFLTGNDFTMYESSSFKANLEADKYRLHTANRRKLRKYIKKGSNDHSIPIQTIWMDPKSFKINSILIKEISNGTDRKLLANYSDFILVGAQLFPHSLEFIAHAEEDYRVFLNYSKVVFNEKLLFPFNVSSKYSKVDYF